MKWGREIFWSNSRSGAYVDKTKILDVMKLGIRDSKTIKDDKIHKLANELIKLVDYHIVSLDNLKYNYLVSLVSTI